MKKEYLYGLLVIMTIAIILSCNNGIKVKKDKDQILIFTDLHQELLDVVEKTTNKEIIAAIDFYIKEDTILDSKVNRIPLYKKLKFELSSDSLAEEPRVILFLVFDKKYQEALKHHIKTKLTDEDCNEFIEIISNMHYYLLFPCDNNCTDSDGNMILPLKNQIERMRKFLE